MDKCPFDYAGLPNHPCILEKDHDGPCMTHDDGDFAPDDIPNDSELLLAVADEIKPKRGRPRSNRARTRRLVIYITTMDYYRLLKMSDPHDLSRWMYGKIRDIIDGTDQ